MSDRYHVGNTPQNRHLIRDDEQATTLALAVTPGVAQRIVHALNTVENLAKEVPQRFALRADGTYEDTGQPHVERPVPESDLIYLDRTVAQPDWDQVIVYSADVVKWLDKVYLWTTDPGSHNTPPVPPWRQQ